MTSNSYRQQALESAAEAVADVMTKRHGRPWVCVIKDPVVDDASQILADILTKRGGRWAPAARKTQSGRRAA